MPTGWFGNMKCWCGEHACYGETQESGQSVYLCETHMPQNEMMQVRPAQYGPEPTPAEVKDLNADDS